MILSHKIRIYPSNKQATYLRKACGIARFSFNWGLAEWKRMYEARKEDPSLPCPNRFLIDKRLNAIKASEFPWMKEVTKCAPQYGTANLGEAFSRFFAKEANFPKFKKKGDRDSFGITNEQFSLKENFIRIPKLGHVRMAENFRFQGRVIRAVVSRKVDKWFVSISAEVNEFQGPVQNKVVGIDLGFSTFAALSIGEKVSHPRPLKKNLNKLRRLSKKVSRKRPGSSNCEKARKRLAKFYGKLANQRSDFLHKTSSKILSDFDVVCIEDLNVRGMSSGNNQGRTVSDLGLSSFRRQLEYKAKKLGKQVVVADRWFPSSKICNSCGNKFTELARKTRNWVCVCGAAHDRDINAAVNLKKYAVGSTVNARGEESSGAAHLDCTKLSSMKQEVAGELALVSASEQYNVQVPISARISFTTAITH